TSMKIDIFKDAECWIKVAPKTLRHIGNSADLGIPVFFVSHIAAEDSDSALLDDFDASDEPKQRRLAGSIRPDHSDHLAGRQLYSHIVQCECFPIPMGNVLDFGYNAIHFSTLPVIWKLDA